MKKVFFSFAIATMMASLASCGGSSNQNTDSQDSTAVEEEVAAEAVEEEANNLIENEVITATLAERWTASKVGKKSFEFTLYKNPEKETGMTTVPTTASSTSWPTLARRASTSSRPPRTASTSSLPLRRCSKA